MVPARLGYGFVQSLPTRPRSVLVRCECVNRGCGRIKNLGGLELIEVNA